MMRVIRYLRQGMRATSMVGLLSILGGAFASFPVQAADFLPTGNMVEARGGHHSTLLPDGTVLVTGGSIANPQSAEIYHPDRGSFSPTGDMLCARTQHTATPLRDGTVLVTGGNGEVRSGEIYHPATGTFVPTGKMLEARTGHTATLLPDGKVLVAGGQRSGSPYLAGAELYDPQSRTFSPTGSMRTARSGHTATLLPTGKVLIAGGSNGASYLDSAELYDPETGTFMQTTAMSDARFHHTATLLPSGKVLVIGGRDAAGRILSTTEIYDCASETFVSTAGRRPFRAHAEHTATLLSNGMVLVAGGVDSNRSVQSYAELYFPEQDFFLPVAGMIEPRIYHTATLLPNGSVLICGDLHGQSSAELFVGQSPVFAPTGSMAVERLGHTATPLPGGKVLIAGGRSNDWESLSTAELYDPATGTFSSTGSLNVSRFWHTATLLPDGKVLIAGGSDGDRNTLASAELYDPVAGLFTSAGSMTVARTGAMATLLRNGDVLFTGGDPLCRTAEIFDSRSKTFIPAGSMSDSRQLHTAVRLPDGNVLIAGGYSWLTGNSLDSAEIYDCATATFTPAGSMTTARESHVAVLLSDGKVLIAGGLVWQTGALGLDSAELYNPTTGTFTSTGRMTAPRQNGHFATPLPGGKVLIAGGGDFLENTRMSTAELYDPSFGIFTRIGDMAEARTGATATALPGGSVLVAGGDNHTTLSGAELFYVPFAPEPTRVLTVASGSHDSAAVVEIGQTDNETYFLDGETPFFTRTVPVGSPVVLSTSLTVDGKVPVWSGCDSAKAGDCLVYMNADRTVSVSFEPVSVTVGTFPPGLSFTVDGVTYTSPQTFSWGVGSNHAVYTAPSQRGDDGTYYGFGNWLDLGVETLVLTVDPSLTAITANFGVLQPRIDVHPPASVSPGETYNYLPTSFNASHFTIANKPSWASFDPLTGALTGTPAAADVGVYGNIVIAAHNGDLWESWPGFSVTVQGVKVTVQTSPAGRGFIVDGISYTTAKTFTWIPGSEHSIATTSYQAGSPGTRYAFANWSNGAPDSHTFAVPAISTTLTAGFTTEYQLSTAVNPTGGGVASPGPAAWYPAGTSVNLQVVPDKDYRFVNWSGPVANPAGAGTTVTMTAPATVTAQLAGLPLLSAAIGTKTGLANARVWPVTLANTGKAAALSAGIDRLVLSQTYGAACTPVVTTPMPVPVGDIEAGTSAVGKVAIDFSGCASTARFSVAVTFGAANGGGGTKFVVNQFR